MKIVKLIAICCLLAGSAVSAKSELNATQLRAASYLLKKADRQAFFENLPNDCHPGQPPAGNADCVKYVAGSYPSTDERLRAARACAGVYSNECVQYVAGNYPSFEEREAAARSCVGANSSECAQYVAGSYPSTEQRQQAALACRYADVNCVKQVAGNYPSFDEKIAAAKACGGN